MAVTITPTYPIAGETVTLGLTSATGNKVVYGIDSLPPESELAAGLIAAVADVLDEGLSASSIIENGLEKLTFLPDKHGEYSITAYDILEVRGIPRYNGDPSGELRYRTVGTQTTTVHIGDYTYLDVVTIGGDNIRLRLQVNNHHVRGAAYVDWTTEKARIAAAATTVVTALSALIGVTVAGIGTDLQTGVNDLRANYESHIATVGAVHLAADNVNNVVIDDADSQGAAITLLNEINADLNGHRATGTWHSADDGKNTPLIAAASDLGSATVLSADLRERVYERHRMQIAAPDVHAGADGVNFLNAPSKLDDVITTYLDALALVNPTAPAGEGDGLVDANHRHGFEV